MKPVTLYTTPFCGYCLAAKRLLADKGVAFEEIDVVAEPARRAEMVARAKGAPDRAADLRRRRACRRASSEICALDRAGKLDPMLAG